jgi:hypothetical protein
MYKRIRFRQIPQLEGELQICANRRDLAVRESGAKGGLGNVADDDLPQPHSIHVGTLTRVCGQCVRNQAVPATVPRGTPSR